jgi:two-component system, NarL family, response regulator DevR
MAPEPDDGRLLVLLVDQATPVRERMRAILEETITGCVVSEAGSFREAKELLSRTYQDLVMLDLDLPDGDGLKVLTYAKQRRQECIVAVLTNYVDVEIRQCCLTLGADYFFEKSTEFEQAVETISSLVHWVESPQCS